MLDNTTIIHVAADSKYIIQFKEDTSPDDVRRATVIIREWWESKYPFMILPNTVLIVRVDDNDETGQSDRESE